MTHNTPQPETLDDLLFALRDDELTQQQASELERLVLNDADAMRHYLRVVNLGVGLRWMTDGGYGGRKTPVVESAVRHSPLDCRLCPPPSPVLTFLGNAVHGTIDYSSSGWLMAYLVATVIFAIGLAVGAFIHVSRYEQVAERSRPVAAESRLESEPMPEMVGQITGMIDCRWADPATAPVGAVAVPLGRKYALASGLMEITYDTGAKVILHGPATYEVESSAGGYLSLGRLTARLEKGSGIRGQGSEETHLKSEIRNLKSEISGPWPLTPGPFAIRTPTATVTDLGTEFGVEVDGQGNTTSQVYRGKVRLEVSSAIRQGKGVAQVLRENQVARVTIGRADRVEMLDASVAPLNLVRRLPKSSLKVLDLADVVSGGDGFSGNRGRGIDPTTGRLTNAFPTVRPVGDHKYHRVEGLPFIDGAFIADGGIGPVQVTSTGITFDYFSIRTSNWGSGLILGGGPIIYPFDAPVPTDVGGVDYASSGHCLVFVAANNGITFDLDAIRKAHSGWKLLRFRAVAGNTENASITHSDLPCRADFWVLVDGKSRFQRREITRQHGAFPIVISLDDKDRFLTLVSTDSGNDNLGDTIIYGDPRLELLSTEPDRESESRPK